MCTGEAIDSPCEHSDSSDGTVNELRGSPRNTCHNRCSVNICEAKRGFSSRDNVEERDEILEF